MLVPAGVEELVMLVPAGMEALVMLVPAGVEVICIAFKLCLLITKNPIT